jgi:hypothetical protein
VIRLRDADDVMYVRGLFGRGQPLRRHPQDWLSRLLGARAVSVPASAGSDRLCCGCPCLASHVHGPADGPQSLLG